LFFHGFFEASGIDGDALGFQRVLREVERESIGVVEFEGDVARECAAFREIFGFLVEEFEAALERGFETGFFLFQRFGDEAFGAFQFRVCRAHHAEERREQAVHQRFFGA
jgi:hypothetical protein